MPRLSERLWDSKFRQGTEKQTGSNLVAEKNA